MNYTKIIQEVQQLYDTACHAEVEIPEHDKFPFESVYAGQNDAIGTIMEEDACILCSSTGTGKSACFLTAAHEIHVPTLVIEPRKFLQVQIADYFNDFVLFGKNEYPCYYAPSAAQAPCVKVHVKDEQKYFYVRNQRTNQLDEKKYPCKGCKYLGAKMLAYITLKERDVLITNMGNFWQWVDLAEFVIIDEADELLRSISSGIELKYVSTKDIDSLTLEEVFKQEETNINMEIDGITDKKTIESEDAKKLNALQNHMERVSFLRSNKDICFHYVKKSTKKVYVEIQPQKNILLVDRVFGDKKILLVSATPSSFM